MSSIIVKDTAMAVEEITWKYRIDVFGGDMDKAAKLSGYVEQVYLANPGLAALGHFIPVGTEIVMPDLNTSATPPVNRLWG